MATVIGDKVKLANGQLVSPQQGAWYDAQQYWGGTLSAPGQISSKSNQVGAGQQVSNEVVAQTNPANVAYIQKQQQAYQATPAASPSAATPVDMSATASPSVTPGGAGIGTTTSTPLDLTGLYKTLNENSGVSALEQKLADAATSYADAQSKINDNPFLSESNRVGRISKLSTDYQNAVKNDQDALAMKKADIETQINIATKQYDINSQAAKDSLDRFNSLLSSGALETASGTDIANIAVSTGLSTSAIQSAINANKAKNVKTEVVSYDDGTNQGYAVINTQTGDIISNNVIGKSKPKASSASGDTTDLSQKDQQGSVDSTVNSYVSDEGYQAKISPEDLYLLLIKSFPGAFDYIKQNFTPEKIRAKTT